MAERVVVAGAGHAAGQLVARLRAEEFAGEIVLVGDETTLPYQRPPLSKAYMAGEIGLERVLLRNQAFYDDNNIDVRLNTRVDAVDCDAKSVTLNDGEKLEYTHLVLATGTRVRELPVAGADLSGVFYLRSLEDADGIGAALKTTPRVAVVGGGYIGLEVAAIARKAGCEVTVLEAMPRVLARTTTETTSAHMTELHAGHGVSIRTGAKVASFAGDGGQVSGVVLDDGELVPAEVVVVGVGVLPNQEIAEAAGITVDDGIVVDARGATNAENVWAIGDCTRHPSALYGTTLRLESVHNAMTQSRVVAANIAGKSIEYNEVPWFWTDQYDAKLQSVGIPDGHDQTVVRGDPSAGAFTVFALKAGRVIAAESVNAMREHMDCRKLAGAQAEVAADVLADPETNLKELL